MKLFDPTQSSDLSTMQEDTYGEPINIPSPLQLRQQSREPQQPAFQQMPSSNDNRLIGNMSIGEESTGSSIPSFGVEEAGGGLPGVISIGGEQTRPITAPQAVARIEEQRRIGIQQLAQGVSGINPALAQVPVEKPLTPEQQAWNRELAVRHVIAYRQAEKDKADQIRESSLGKGGISGKAARTMVAAGITKDYPVSKQNLDILEKTIDIYNGHRAGTVTAEDIAIAKELLDIKGNQTAANISLGKFGVQFAEAVDAESQSALRKIKAVMDGPNAPTSISQWQKLVDESSSPFVNGLVREEASKYRPEIFRIEEGMAKANEIPFQKWLIDKYQLDPTRASRLVTQNSMTDANNQNPNIKKFYEEYQREKPEGSVYIGDDGRLKEHKLSEYEKRLKIHQDYVRGGVNQRLSANGPVSFNPGDPVQADVYKEMGYNPSIVGFDDNAKNYMDSIDTSGSGQAVWGSRELGVENIIKNATKAYDSNPTPEGFAKAMDSAISEGFASGDLTGVNNPSSRKVIASEMIGIMKGRYETQRQEADEAKKASLDAAHHSIDDKLTKATTHVDPVTGTTTVKARAINEDFLPTLTQADTAPYLIDKEQIYAGDPHIQKDGKNIARIDTPKEYEYFAGRILMDKLGLTNPEDEMYKFVSDAIVAGKAGRRGYSEAIDIALTKIEGDLERGNFTRIGKDNDRIEAEKKIRSEQAFALDRKLSGLPEQQRPSVDAAIFSPDNTRVEKVFESKRLKDLYQNIESPDLKQNFMEGLVQDAHGILRSDTSTKLQEIKELVYTNNTQDLKSKGLADPEVNRLIDDAISQSFGVEEGKGTLKYGDFKLEPLSKLWPIGDKTVNQLPPRIRNLYDAGWNRMKEQGKSDDGYKMMKAAALMHRQYYISNLIQDNTTAYQLAKNAVSALYAVSEKPQEGANIYADIVNLENQIDKDPSLVVKLSGIHERILEENKKKLRNGITAISKEYSTKDSVMPDDIKVVIEYLMRVIEVSDGLLRKINIPLLSPAWAGMLRYKYRF